jgi:internalin A
MSELARRLIAENAATQATFLDLGNCGLSEIPRGLQQLTWLESLSLASEWDVWAGSTWLRMASSNGGQANRFTKLGSLKGLTRLTSLMLDRTDARDLTPLAGLGNLRWLGLTRSRVLDLSALGNLKALEVLNIGYTGVEDLGPIAELRALKVLNALFTAVADLAPLSELTELRMLSVSNTLVHDLAPLAGLTSLEYLRASHTAVTDLRPLAGLIALKSLSVSGTQVSDLTPLAHLGALERVNISKTPVTDLSPLLAQINAGRPVTWLQLGAEEQGIYVAGCPLLSPPVEIVVRGNAAILNYFREREGGRVAHLYEAKLLILGEGGSGKTSLLRRLYQRELPLPAEQDSTRGIAIHRHEFTLKNGRRFRLNVWDFGGQEIYHATHQFFLTRRSLYLLVDDTRKDHKSVSDEGFKFWLELIDLFGGHSPVLIFQNEKGGRSKAIDLTGIKARFDNVRERYAGNLEDPESANALRDAIELYAGQLSHIGEELPARWIRVRDDIERRAAETPHITQLEYFEVYGRHLEPDRTKALHLSRYLHDLGVFLHFQDDPLLARTVILQNEWATEAVFRILDDEEVKARLGRFSREDCERLWRDSKYAEMHLELVALMQRFELCYALPDSRPETWLAPQLLPPAKPAALAPWNESRDRDLALRYRYDFMPKGLISRLTVRLHRFVRDPELAWRTGVLFEREDTSVLVEVLPDGRELELRARGRERKGLLSVVAADLDALNDSFQGLSDKVDKRIPCNCSRCATSPIPEFFAQKALRKRRDDRRLRVECPGSYEDVDVLELLDGIRTDTLPVWANDARPAGALRKVRIFLASSSELREDRDAFDLYFRQRNDHLLEQGRYFEIVRWERFLDAISETRMQDEYNKAVRDADVVVCLFFTKAGAFTEEEFDAAYGQFKASGKPRIFTFFKNAAIMTGDDREDDLTSLWRFKKKLKDLGHFHTTYTSIEDLKLQFRDQLDRLDL